MRNTYVLFQRLPTVYGIKAEVSRCHGYMHLNNDSKSQRRTLNTWCVILNQVDIHGGQNAWDDNECSQTQKYDWVSESFWIYNS